MSYDPSRARQDRDEEDWEAGTEDGVNKNLRPSARSFVPRPPGPSSSQPGPSRGQNNPSRQDEDDWFDSGRPVSNRQLWDSANKAPGPTLLMPRPEHGSMPVNQIKILRRDPNVGQKKSPSPTVTNQKTMEERAQEYRRARERIFGKEAEEDKSSSPVGGAGPNIGQGERSGTNSPKGDFAFVPTQVRRSPATPGERPRPGGQGGAGNGRAPGGEGESRRIVRQPRGPGQGGGFGGRGAHSG